MKLIFSWLKEFVDFKESPQRIAEALTMAGHEVESLVPLHKPKGVSGDWLMEVAITPNRGDCLGILGLAREVAALTGGRLRPPPVSPHKNSPELRRFVDVKIVSPRLCPRYSARMVQGIRVALSPAWMRLRLEECGIRSINNVVDVTNYVMLETGQPLHAFDFDRLKSGRIVVRQAGASGKFVTLDEVERELAPQDLLICDGDAPVALAGVMGGKDSEVGAETRRVLLESAHFDPLSVRRTARRLGLRSEASHRFERGVDPEGTLYALDRAVFLLAEIAGGAPIEGCVDRYPRRPRPAPIVLRSRKIKQLLAVDMRPSEVERILNSLGLKIQARSKSGLKVISPCYRRDLTREADLIEELARVRGYEKIPLTFPAVKLQGGKVDARLGQERRMRCFLTGEGLTEVINLPFTSGEMNRRFCAPEAGRPVAILNPLVQENAEMRLSLIPGLVRNLRTQTAQKAESFWAFDLGKVFYLDGESSVRERQHLAGIVYGQRERRGLRTKERPVTFLELKGLVDGILEVIGLADGAVWTSDGIALFLHPGKATTLRAGGSSLGFAGEVHPDLREELALPPFSLFELDFEELFQYAPPQLKARPLPRFPSVERDVAVVVDDEFPAQRIISWIKGLNHSLIEDVAVFDHYRGSPIPDGKKSLAYAIRYRAADRTLTDAEVNALHQDLVAKIGEVFGAQLRG